MKAALVMSPTLRSALFSADTERRLAEHADLRWSESDQPGPDELVAVARDARVLVSSWFTPRVDAAVLEQCPDLELVLHAAGSIKPVVSDALWERGVRVSSSAGALGRGVAESALGMTIASLKNHWRLSSDIRQGGWTAERGRVRELYDVVVGVISAGNAGGHYIALLQAFEVEVLLFDPGVSDDQAAALGARKVGLDELVANSDVISVHAPSLPATEHLIDAHRLAAMKDDAILVNTSRGSVIDEVALASELSKGRLFACLDVTAPEPPAADNPLRSLPNCVLTGHVAGAVTNGKRRVGKHVADELGRFLAGEPMTGEVTRSRLAEVA